MGVSSVAAALGLLSLAAAQHPGNITENHPRLTTYHCTNASGCSAKDVAVVLESSKRSVYQVNAPDYGCGTQGAAPNITACPDVETCQENCIMQGVSDYSTVGVTTDGSSISLVQLDANLNKITPRVYLLSTEDDEQSYEMFNLLGQELAFQVDVSKLPCGMNGALYMIEMEKNGGKDNINTGGAYYGTGYCDAQCYIYPFINGKANIDAYGSCCNELDIWEANDQATQLAPHTCNQTGLYQCSGAECSKGGVCDHNGCAFNPYAEGNHTFYGVGSGMTVDTSRPFTVVTQFPTDENGTLTEFRRLYVQDGNVIQNSVVTLSSYPKVNVIDDNYCEYAGGSEFLRLGATQGMGEALARGMVLSMSVWWDNSTYMNWLDSGSAGPCGSTNGTPVNIIADQPDTSVTFSNIKWGELGSTYKKCK
ncbi:hypothetical protein SBRCBS47491_009858 [Sporothrix bragantina]|uniref:Glucanase n=1 Tax=Sporothrix bragantina TaxID=671064 RepID=A0ABP0CZY0_9PEZI